jgi:predicted HTH transcriptional regulator
LQEENKNFAQKNERSLSEVLSEVFDAKDTEKLLPILRYLETHAGITPNEAEQVTGKSAATARRYLKMLAERGLLLTEGKTNKTRYILTTTKMPTEDLLDRKTN